MSGGLWDYKDISLKNEMFPYREMQNVLEDRELSELAFDLFEVLHAFDWYMSGDTGRDTYIRAKKKFKDKWLPKDETRTKRIVDESVEELRQELYSTFGLEEIDKNTE